MPERSAAPRRLALAFLTLASLLVLLALALFFR
jgi:hypothetical protein